MKDRRIRSISTPRNVASVTFLKLPRICGLLCNWINRKKPTRSKERMLIANTRTGGLGYLDSASMRRLKAAEAAKATRITAKVSDIQVLRRSLFPRETGPITSTQIN
jgi:hypothetical protein